MPHEELAWWNFNIPSSERTAACPDFLLECSEKDRRIIGTWDAQVEPLPWERVKELIESNRIDLFGRLPSDLRRYRKYIHGLKQRHGSVMNFVLQYRLRWCDTTPSGPPFENADDIKILHNDWPYGIDTRIVHLVVWTKFRFEEDSGIGDLTPRARQQIEEYVDKTFRARLKPDTVLWFKNWKSLKSVHAIEHFHVMLFDPDPAFVQEVTGGDTPLSAKAPSADISSIILHKTEAITAMKNPAQRWDLVV